jgi:hypothetical protein
MFVHEGPSLLAQGQTHTAVDPPTITTPEITSPPLGGTSSVEDLIRESRPSRTFVPQQVRTPAGLTQRITPDTAPSGVSVPTAHSDGDACALSPFRAGTDGYVQLGPDARACRCALLRSVRFEAQAEGMSGWVKEHTDVLLRLSSSQRGAQSDRIGDRGIEITNLKIEVHHRALLPVGWWPHWGLVAVRLLKDEKDRSLGSGEDGCSWFLVTNGPPEQLRIEPGQGARVRRFDCRSPPHAVRSRSHVGVCESGYSDVKRRCDDSGMAGGHRNEDRVDPAHRRAALPIPDGVPSAPLEGL